METTKQRWLDVLRGVVSQIDHGPLRISREQLSRAYQAGRERLGVGISELVLAEAELEQAGLVTFGPAREAVIA